MHAYIFGLENSIAIQFGEDIYSLSQHSFLVEIVEWYMHREAAKNTWALAKGGELTLMHSLLCG